MADLGAQGVDKDIRTPNLDALARAGVDKSLEVAETASIYFRVSSDVQNGNEYAKEPTCAVPRHSGRVKAFFFGFHVSSIKDSAMGFQLARTDDQAFWARNHNGTIP